MKIMNFTILAFFLVILSCNSAIKNKKKITEISKVTIDESIIDSLAKLQCDCYDYTLTIEDDNQMKFYGLNCTSSLVKYLTSINYENNNSEIKRNYELEIFNLVGQKVSQNCESFFTFGSILQTKREISTHLLENPELKEFLYNGKFTSLEIDENIITSINENFMKIDFIDLGYFSKLKIEWINDFEYYQIFQESNHPFYSWIKEGDTTIVRIIDINDSIIEYDMIKPYFIYPGKMKIIE